MEKSGNIYALLRREVMILLRHPIYIICMVVLPLFVTLFFTSLLNEGQPVEMPIGIVDNDNTSTTRKLTRMIDGFQSSAVVAHYPSVDNARKAMQRNEIYGFIYFPSHFTQDLISSRQPKMSIYYSNTCMTAGALIFKEMKVLCNLGAAGVGQATLLAKGATAKQAQAFLQPIALETHNIGNPWVNYNIYLSTMLVPTCLLLFVFLLTPYSLGTEIKFNTQKEWLSMAGGDFGLAMFAKLLPQTVIFILTLTLSMVYMFGALQFPAPGGFGRIVLLCILAVLGAQGFAVFMFGMIPSLRMAMSTCSLWGVLSFSMVGTTYPIIAMDAPLQAASWLFPMRHYYTIYQLCIFNDYPLSDALPNIITLIIFALMPVFVIKRMKRAFNEFGYQP